MENIFSTHFLIPSSLPPLASSQDEVFLDRMIDIFATQLTTGLSELEHLGYQKAICQAEQDLALAIGRNEHHAYWHEMEKRVH